MKFTLITLLIIFQIIIIKINADEESDKEYKYFITFPDRVGRCPGLELYEWANALDVRGVEFDDDEARLNGSFKFKKAFDSELPINVIIKIFNIFLILIIFLYLINYNCVNKT